jgi:tRNA 2-thiouridine synthesizing protein A
VRRYGMYVQETAIDGANVDIGGTEASGQPSRIGPDVALDVGTLGCPMLGLKSMKALRSLEPGQTLEITTTGPAAGKALRRVAWITGTKLAAVREEDGKFKFLLRKG